jgi:cystathionine gamma-lyase
MTVTHSPLPLRPHERVTTTADGRIETPARATTPVHNFGTLAVHAGSPLDPSTGAVIAPISLSTTFAQTSLGKPVGLYEYSRSSNPNRDNFEEAIAALEHARYALSFSSGSATTANILQSLAAGSHVISVSDVYGGTYRYFTKVAAAHGVEVTFTPSVELDIESMIKESTKLIWIESPSNPTLSLVDIRAVATIAHRHGILVVVDNTFLSPYIQNPLDHGADIVVHSVTKYINGHSDVVMGVAAFNSEELKERLTFLQNAIGAVPSPFDCWLAHRGLKTLHLRAREASINALSVATALENSPHVIAVNYPGLKSHRQRHIAEKQHRNGMGGGMLSFRLKGGHAAAERFCQSTRIFVLAESLGGVESLVEVPSAMTHAGIPKESRDEIGVFEDLVRISCGIEDAEDLKKDVLQALEKAVVGPKITNGLPVNKKVSIGTIQGSETNGKAF